MTSRDFAYWLQGLFELSDTKQLDERQTELVKRHLAMVFKHEIDPSVGSPEHQSELQELHDGLKTLDESFEKHKAAHHSLTRPPGGGRLMC